MSHTYIKDLFLEAVHSVSTIPSIPGKNPLVTVFLLLTVPVLHFLVNRSLHRKSIRSAKGILQKAFTVYT